MYAAIGTSRLGEQRVSLAGARQAFFEGDFAQALDLCERVHGRDGATRFELAALRARILLRTDRAERAIDALRAVAFDSLSVDQHVTARMLLGASYVRLGQVERGAALLADAERDSAQAHPTIRAELTLNIAIARYRAGAYDDAERLLEAVPKDADLVHARALEYRGWLAQARGDSAAAAQWFRSALDMLDRCDYRDRYVEGSALYGLTMLCPKMMLVDQWSDVERHLRQFDWSASGVGIWRFWTLIAQSMMAETVGDAPLALDLACDAEQNGSNGGYRVVALCRSAAILRGLGEMNAHRAFVRRARLAYDALNLMCLSADLQHIPLNLAEQLVHAGAVDDARTVLGQYRDVVVPNLRMPPGDVEWFHAEERSITAAILETAGERPRAVREFVAAHRVFTQYDGRRQAAEIALRLARLTGHKRYLTYASGVLRSASPSFWMVRELENIGREDGPQLTATESAVLRLLVAGKTYKEIASERRVSVKTVDHRVQILFRKFQVHSRGELAAEAMRRRVVRLHQRERVE